MLRVASDVLCGTYFLLPIVSLVAGWRGRGPLRRSITGAWLSGLLLAAVLLTVYSVALGNPVPITQALMTLLFGVGLMLFLRAVDYALTAAIRLAFRWVKRPGVRIPVVGLTRIALLGGFSIPWVMSALMVYRPRIPTNDVPFEDVAEFQRVKFSAADGTPINGWYFAPAEPSNTTALLCHGLGGTPTGMLHLIDGLHRAGIGVLAIDLRAHGTSGGQRCTFGATEKYDALGAVAWLKQAHAEAAERIVGVGASLGAAALLNAAGDDERLSGVVVLSTYATLPEEVDSISRNQLGWPIGWLTRLFGLPMSSLHAGVDLNDVRPVDSIGRLWPRPVLVVHGTSDEIIPFGQGQKLYDAAPIGRQSFWVQDGTHNGILDDDGVLKRIVQFIKSSRPVPVV